MVTTFMLFEAAVGVGLVALAAAEVRSQRGPLRYGARAALTAAAVGNLAFIVYLVFNHIGFPLHLDLMEGLIQQHVRRVAAGLPAYPAPTPEYVPLAYNPGFYVLAAPFTLVFGDSLPVLRFVAILGFLGCGIVTYLGVRELTGSRWWGLVGVGLFAAAFRAMDAYLDTAHADSWMLCCALLGFWLIGRSSRGARVAGVVVLALAFWFKQHGALFAAAGVLYLTWREGRRAWIYWLVAIVLGPVAYALAQPWPFGPWFHYFTWEVPSGWTEFRMKTAVVRPIVYVASWYLVPFAFSVAAVVSALRTRERFGPWHAAFLAGVASAILGVLDPGSADNIFAGFGATCLLLGAATMGAAPWPRLPRLVTLAGVGVTFAALMYDPRLVVVSPRAGEAYADLVTTLRGLGGPVYGPYQATLPSGFDLDPKVHWATVDDMTRGPHRPAQADSLAARLLAPLRAPAGPQFLLDNLPLEKTQPPVKALASQYALVADWGDRFAALEGTPRRYFHGWPRYLYRFNGPSQSGAK